MISTPSKPDFLSRYLIDRIAATSNIELRVRATVAASSGMEDGTLESVDLASRGDRWNLGSSESSWRTKPTSIAITKSEYRE